jgi:small subunit ribosomal protein S4e
MKRHLKRLAAPVTWNIKRKKTTFIVKPHPSGHKREASTSLNLFMKEMAGLAKTTKEVKTILQNKKVLVDGKQRKDHRFAVGFLDTVQIEETNDAFRVTLDRKGRISYVTIPPKEASIKVCKIINKTMTKGKKLQLNLNDGKNIFVDAKTKYKAGDSVVVDCNENKVTEHLPFDKNMTVFLTAGKNKGAIGKITEIAERVFTIKTEKAKEYKTRRENGFIVGKGQSAVSIKLASK